MDFNSEVVEASYQNPVVVDFWAPWCGPCRVLGPVIEELADESAGKWELVKVNTEEEQEIAMDYGIRSIPNVKLFYEGEVISEFAGALPKHQIELWLNENLPTAGSKAWKTLVTMLEDPTQDDVPLLETFLSDYPDHKEARVRLAKLVAFRDPYRAKTLLGEVKMADEHYEVAQDLQVLQHLADADYSTENGKISETMKNVAEAVRNENMEKAAESIIEAVSIDKSYADDLPRKVGIALFRLLGIQHPVTKKYRRTFDMWLS